MYALMVNFLIFQIYYSLFFAHFLFMHVIDKNRKTQNNIIQAHTNHNEHNICFGKPLWDKTQLEGEVALFFFF